MIKAFIIITIIVCVLIIITIVDNPREQMDKQVSNKQKTSYIIHVIPGKYLININGKLTQTNNAEEVACIILTHFSKHNFDEHFDSTSPLAKKMCEELAKNKIIELPLGQWEITLQELSELGDDKY